MRKFAGLALLAAAAAFAVTSAFAGDKQKEKSCCVAKGEMDCAATYAKLNLTAEQKAKMDALVEKCKGSAARKRAPKPL